MWSVTKFASVLLVTLALGALQIAGPSFNAAPQASHTTNQQLKQTNESLPSSASWHLPQYQDANRGSLFFLNNNQDPKQPTELNPSLKTQVKINVTGVVARTQLTQTFKNASDQWVNGIYVFPLPENAAVDHLQMRIGERVIEGQIKEKQQARQLYETAVQQGKKASLIVQQRPNLFTNSVANIGPGELVSITIEYQQTLAYQQNTYSLRFPMAITPRYYPPITNPTANDEQQQDTQPAYSSPHDSVYKKDVPTSLEEDISIEVILHTGFAVRNLKSEFHPIATTKLAQGDYLIQLDKKTIANQDFVLSWQPELSNTPKVAHFQQDVNGHQYGLLMIYPPINTGAETGIDNQAREVIFVLDTSGSMSGASLNQAKQALLFALTQLQHQDSFNVIEFNSYAQKLWQHPKQANSDAITEAKYFISNLVANGGTEIATALSLALARESDEQSFSRLRQVIFITDGSIGNEESLMQLITKNLGESRLFTVGIGSAPNSYFMTEAALVGRGAYTYIGSIEQIHTSMGKLFTKLAHPALTDIQFMINDQVANLQNHIESYPSVISDVYIGEPLILSYRRAKTDIQQGALSLHGKYQQAPWNQTIETSISKPQTGLNVLWARQKISQLSRDQRTVSLDSVDHAQGDYFKQLIIETAIEHHLVSQYTSLVAIDITPTNTTANKSSNQQVANRVPKGSVNSPLALLPQTATSAQLKIIWGGLMIGVTLCILIFIRRKNVV